MSDQKTIALQARRSLIVLASALAVGVALYGGTHWYKDRARAQFTQAQQQAIDSQATLSQKQADLASLQANISRFAVLRQQGLVGLPDRAAWVEQLTASRARLDLPNTLSYTLQTPKPLTLQSGQGVAVPGQTDAPDAQQAAFHDLEVTLANIHEEELLALLHDYQTQVKGRFRVNDCALSTPSESGLSARCTLRFFTLPEAVSGPATQ